MAQMYKRETELNNEPFSNYWGVPVNRLLKICGKRWLFDPAVCEGLIIEEFIGNCMVSAPAWSMGWEMWQIRIISYFIWFISLEINQLIWIPMIILFCQENKIWAENGWSISAYFFKFKSKLTSARLCFKLNFRASKRIILLKTLIIIIFNI